MKTLNVIKSGLAASACLGLLAACQGQGAFHAKLFTPAERVHFQDVYNQQHGVNKPAANSPEGTPVAGDTKAPANPVTPEKPTQGTDTGKGQQGPGQNTGPILSGQTGGTSGQTSTGAPVGTPTTPGDAASGKVITENVTADTLKAQNMLDLQAFNAEAQTMVSAVTVSIKGTGPDQLSVGVDAVVNLDTAQRFLFVQDTMIAFNKDGSVLTLPISLQENSSGGANLLGPGDDTVQGKAFCTDVTCTEIQIRFEFKLKDKTVPVVFQMRFDSASKVYQLHSNIGDNPKSYNDFIKDADQPAKPVTPPANPTPGPTAGATGSTPDTPPAPPVDSKDGKDGKDGDANATPDKNAKPPYDPLSSIRVTPQNTPSTTTKPSVSTPPAYDPLSSIRVTSQNTPSTTKPSTSTPPPYDPLTSIHFNPDSLKQPPASPSGAAQAATPAVANTGASTPAVPSTGASSTPAAPAGSSPASPATTQPTGGAAAGPSAQPGVGAGLSAPAVPSVAKQAIADASAPAAKPKPTVVNLQNQGPELVGDVDPAVKAIEQAGGVP